MATQLAEGDVFDVGNWLDRAQGRTPGVAAAAPSHAVGSPVPVSYEPRHRADVPVDSVA
jgi:hypothetical protein